MNRHHIVMQMGAADRFTVRPEDDRAIVSKVSCVYAKDSIDFGLDHLLGAARIRGLTPSEVAFDLVFLATAVMGTDTRVSREGHSQDGWTRELHLYLPVSDVSMWTARIPALKRMLNFLTGDRWEFTFRDRPRRFRRVVGPPNELNMNDAYSCVSLLSGGLDSFIGAIDLLDRGERPLFVSHFWDGATSAYQAAVVALLEREFGAKKVDSVRIRNGFAQGAIKRGGVESTQRSRSFLFFALAAFLGSGIGSAIEVLVPENGLIGLNVPLDPLRLGALSTRTAHPFYLARWNDLLAALGLAVSLRNPHATQTKGRMVKDCARKAFLKKNLRSTMSCSSPTKARFKGKAPQHCGYCLPCLIRRASILKGLGDDTTEYSIELKGRVPSTTAAGKHIRSFQYACNALKKNPALAQFAVHKPGPLTDVSDSISDYVAVYRDGMKEIDTLLAGVKTVP
jgi:7-cyano-7-deazaguanine synthase in queuosine biosynthesis